MKTVIRYTVWLLLTLLTATATATPEEISSMTCSETEKKLVELMNVKSTALDQFADDVWERMGRTAPSEPVRPPVWKTSPWRDKNTMSCIVAPGNMELFLSKLHAVRDSLDGHPEVQRMFVNMTDTLMKTADHLYGLQMPPRMITEYGLFSKEREFLNSRALFPLFNDTVINILKRTRKGRSVLKDLGIKPKAPPLEIVARDVPLEFPKKRALWPPGVTAPILDALMTKKYVLMCEGDGTEVPKSEWASLGFASRRMRHQEFNVAFGAYEMTYSMSFTEPLRYFCATTVNNSVYIDVFTQSIRTSSTGFLLSAIYRARDLSGYSIISNEWQRVLSLRMRQILQFINEAGWVVRSLKGDAVWIDLDRGAFPVLLDFSTAYNANQTRVRYPTSRDIPEAAYQVQLATLIHAITDPSKNATTQPEGDWLRSFGEGLVDLQAQVKLWSEDAMKKRDKSYLDKLRKEQRSDIPRPKGRPPSERAPSPSSPSSAPRRE